MVNITEMEDDGSVKKNYKIENSEVYCLSQFETNGEIN